MNTADVLTENMKEFIPAPTAPDEPEKIEIALPNKIGQTESGTIMEAADVLAGTGEFFLSNDRVVQVSGDRLIVPTPAGLAADSGKWIDCTGWIKEEEVRKSFPKSLAQGLLESEQAKTLFPVIKLKSEVLLPYQENGVLKFTVPGYNPAHKIWTPAVAIPVRRIPLQDAVGLLRYILRGFCFLETELDIARTLAYLLSPMLTLLTNGCRAMIFYACGNRPGLGKDYLLAMAPLIYTGQQAAFYPPAGSDDEYRKLLLAACVALEQFILISNFKEHLDSPALEQAATSPYIKGRVLGKTELCSAANMAVYGLSSNGGTISPDLERRVLDIRLVFLEEDVTRRIFECDVHEYLLGNRALVLSALYSLIIHWAEQGFTLTGTAIPSFLRWSQVVSGILVACGFQNPFDKRQVIAAALEDSGNREDRDFAALLELWFNGPEPKTLSSCHVRSLATQLELFAWLDLAERSGQVAFAAILRQRGLRTFNGLRLTIVRGRTSFYGVEKA